MCRVRPEQLSHKRWRPLHRPYRETQLSRWGTNNEGARLVRRAGAFTAARWLHPEGDLVGLDGPPAPTRRWGRRSSAREVHPVFAAVVELPTWIALRGSSWPEEPKGGGARFSKTVDPAGRRRRSSSLRPRAAAQRRWPRLLFGHARAVSASPRRHELSFGMIPRRLSGQRFASIWRLYAARIASSSTFGSTSYARKFSMLSCLMWICPSPVFPRCCPVE